MFSGTAQVSQQVCQFLFVSSVCFLVRVTVVDKNKAVVCCLLATSAVMLSEKKKKREMWSKEVVFEKEKKHAMREPESSVGIATAYWLDGPGIEFRWD